MYDNTDTTIQITLTPNDACRVAYTINNLQPVRSSYISDEPLFFMDCDHDMIDDEDNQDYFLFDELAELSEDSISKEKQFSDYIPNIQSEFKENKFLSSKEDSLSISEIINITKKSRYASSLLDSLENINISYSNNIEDSIYIKETKTILINSNISNPEKILFLSKELRRAWQDKSGVLIQPMLFHPDQGILINRALEADLTANMIKIAWELQLNNYKNCWDLLENSSLSDIAQAFSKEAYTDFRTINNGKAIAAAFEAWFLSERCNNMDKILIQQMLADEHGYIFGEYMNSSISVTIDLISALGTVPYGKNYLINYAHLIIEDPIFTEVRDRANSNFLWFIKFERSFRESEQELQTHSSGLVNNENTVSNNDKQKNKILEFKQTQRKSSSTGNNNGEAEIIWIHSARN